MMKTILAGFICLFIYTQINAQNDSTTTTPVSYKATADTIPLLSFSSQEIPVKKQPVYKLKPIVDVPLFAVNTAWTLYAFTKIYSKQPTDAEVVLNLNKNDINSFDRWAVRPYSPHLDKLAYIPFNASMPLPLLFLIPQKTRKDFFKLTFLYLEAMSITGLLYTGSTYLIDRYRPYVYSSGTTMEQRMNGGGKNSFYAGHPALVATSLFFGAKVLSDYFPESKIKWVYYTVAAGVTGLTAYWRHRGGMHFPSDLLLGVAQGTLTGILVPHFHKHRIIKDPNLSLVPFTNGIDHGLALIYKLK
jgi:membrane-associated phospholipid phosphatase